MMLWTHALLGDGCWDWQASKNPKGYGYAVVGGRVRRAHRAAWEDFYGPIPEGMQVLHSCDNPSCVRPDHLWLGTNTDNRRDAAAKGRARNQYADITQCKRGHDLADAYVHGGRRFCRECRRIRQKKG